MFLGQRLRLPVVAASFLIAAMHAEAAPSLVSQSAFTSPTVVNFNTIGNAVQITNQLAGQGVTFSGGIYGLTNPGDIDLYPGPPTAIASDWIYSAGSNPQSLPITVTFTSVQTLVGFLDEMNVGDSTVVTTFLNGTPHGSVTLVETSGLQFLGVSDPAGFNSITINMIGTSNHFLAFNTLEFQSGGGGPTPNTTPIPSSWILSLTGLAGIGLYQGRNRLMDWLRG